MKLMVLGSARHGKDTVCSLLRDLYGLTFISSSFFVAEKAVRPHLAVLGIHYPTIQDCYNDRINHRSDWFNAIVAYNRDDPARLGKELFAQYDIYCGLRNRVEFHALKAENVFDVCLWVDRSHHVPPEAPSSFNMTFAVADYIIDNNGDLAELEVNIVETMDRAMDDGRIEFREPNLLRA